uniref:Structural protein n=1 Tax=Steinernema glaseri TaxID=37863 RepID=A0A1I7XXI7_9BILA
MKIVSKELLLHCTHSSDSSFPGPLHGSGEDVTYLSHLETNSNASFELFALHEAVKSICLVCQSGEMEPRTWSLELCADGQFIQTPTFSFSFNPPTRWTYLDSTYRLPGDTSTTPYLLYPGQWATQRDAKQAMENDLRNAILRALQKQKIYGGFPQLTVSGYTPENGFITMDSTAGVRKVGSYVAEGGSVTVQRNVVDKDTGTPIVKQLTVRVTGLLAADITQWRNIANQLFVTMSVESKVRFLTEINVY